MRHTTQPKRGRNGSKFPGICADAKALGVDRTTLLRTLKGEWKLKTLSARYRELKGQKLSASEVLLINDFNRRVRTGKGDLELLRSFDRMVATKTSPSK